MRMHAQACVHWLKYTTYKYLIIGSLLQLLLDNESAPMITDSAVIVETFLPDAADVGQGQVGLVAKPIVNGQSCS